MILTLVPSQGCKKSHHKFNVSVTTPASESILQSMSRLRIIVGYLGSKMLGNWWDCSLLDATGLNFLLNTFPRSAHFAAIATTVESAQRFHDEALGKIGTYHLFRLPTRFEERVWERNTTDWIPDSKTAAMDALAEFADTTIVAPHGPVQVGTENKILTDTSIKELAAHYHSAFSQGIKCFPYFSKNK